MYRTNEKLKQCISTPIQPGGRRQGPSFIHYPDGGIQELTGSPLYHMIITIDNNTHSGGVSLQQTKERKLLYPKINFFS